MKKKIIKIIYRFIAYFLFVNLYIQYTACNYDILLKLYSSYINIYEALIFCLVISTVKLILKQNKKNFLNFLRLV